MLVSCCGLWSFRMGLIVLVSKVISFTLQFRLLIVSEVPIVILHGMHILWSVSLVRMSSKWESLHMVLLFIRVGWHFKFGLLCMNAESAVSK